MTTPDYKDDKNLINAFPNPFVAPEVKEKDEYGLAEARAIWNAYNQNLAVWGGRKSQWILNRKYAEGRQAVDKYKNRLDITGDTSFLNLDFTPIPIIPTRVDNLQGRLMNQQYKIQLNPIDPASRTEEDEKRKELKTKMFLKDLAPDMEATTGIPVIPSHEYIPEDLEELEIFLGMHFKTAVCTAMELILDDILYVENDFESVRAQILRDFIVLKCAGIKKYYDSNYKICVESVDPVDIITPYSKHDDFRNIDYIGLIKKITIGQLATSTRKFTEEQLYNIAKSYAGRIDNPVWNQGWTYSPEGYYATDGFMGRPYDNFYINVMEFEFMSIDEMKYEYKENDHGTKYFEKKNYNYKPQEGSSKLKKKLHTKKINNRYEGCWIIGSEYIYNYKKSENMIREKQGNSYSSNTCFSIRLICPDIYDMVNTSLVERMIPHADQMTLIHLKIQQFIGKAMPPGHGYNQTAIEAMIKAMGSGANPTKEFIQMITQTGSFVFQGQYPDGQQVNTPVVPLANGMGDIVGLLNAYNQEYEMLNSIISFNSATDGSTPNSEALVGVQKLAVQGTNNSMRPINSSYLKLIRLVASDLCLMVQDKIEYGDGLESFSKAISRAALDTVEMGKKITMAQLGVKVEYLPDEIERAEIAEDLRIAQQSVPPQIKVNDAITVRQLLKSNVKYAAQMLAYKIRKYKEEQVAEQTAAIQANTESQIQSNQAAKAAEIEAETMLSKLRMEEARFEAELQKGIENTKHENKMKEIALQNQGLVERQRVTNDGAIVKESIVQVKSLETAA